MATRTEGGTMRDTRGTEIKRLLRSLYPEAQFQVHLEKYSMGESIVGWCSRCEGQNVVLFRGRWSCGCVQSDGGVTRWRKSWTAWRDEQ
mgnify:CR=1 FL=1